MIIDSGGTPMTMIIWRLRCEQCGKVHHELPDVVVPYKRHCAETIEKVIEGKVEEVAARRAQSGESRSGGRGTGNTFKVCWHHLPGNTERCSAVSQRR